MQIRQHWSSSWQRARQVQAFGPSRHPGSFGLVSLWLRQVGSSAALRLDASAGLLAFASLGMMGAAALAVLIAVNPAGEIERARQAQIDLEDELLCQKFGFHPDTAQMTGCKLDLLDLRHRDEDMQPSDSGAAF